MSDWRDAEIEVLEQHVRELGELVRLLGDAEARFEFHRDTKAATDTRSYAGLVRERAAGYTDRARKLRAGEDRPQELPVTYFSRRV